MRRDKKIFLRSFFSARNLLPCKKTTATNGGSFAGIQSYQLHVPMVTGFHGAQIPKLSFQCSRTQAFTQELCESPLREPSYQWLPPLAICRVFPGWTQVDSYRNGRGSRTERGFVHTVQLERTAYPELSVRRGMRQTRP